MCILSNPQYNGNHLAEKIPLPQPRISHSVWTDGLPVGDESMGLEEAIHQMMSWLRHFVQHDEAIELRVLEVADGRMKRTYGGFYDADHLHEMARQALDITSDAQGVYFSLNPLHKDLLSRRYNRIDVAGTSDSASDVDVVRRRWLLIDADPKRKAGISASDTEKARAKAVIIKVGEYLCSQGWPEPIFADSGNGFHLLYPIDLPTDDGGLVKRVLASLAKQFDTDEVEIDQKVFNPSRIVKLYGTRARKGDDTTERPHRWTKVLNMPKELQNVPVAMLETVAAQEGPTAASQSVESADNRDGYRFGHELVKERAVAYLRKVPPAVAGQGGHDQTFSAACVLVLGFDLRVEDALPLLKQWNETCQPPWSERELLHKLQDANKQTGERGHLLDPVHPKDGNLGASPAQKSGESDADGSEPLKHEDDPNRLARLFRDKCYTHAGSPTLRFWRGDWYRWENNRYRPIGLEELRGELWRSVEEEFDRLNRVALKDRANSQVAGLRVPLKPPRAQKVTNDLVNNVRSALSSLVTLPGNLQQPAWIDAANAFPAEEMIAAPNGLVHVPSLLGGQLCLQNPTPKFFNSMALDYPIDLHAPSPSNWLDFLNQLWPSDPESIHALQQWFGYCLLPDTSLQKLLFLLGPPRSGKGTIARILRALIGADNVAGPTLSGLATNFGLSPLLNKALAIVSDARLSGRSDQSVIVERLLSITGEDALTIDRKNREPVTVHLPTRVLLISNELPKLTDASGALVSRMVLLQMRSSWLGKEDTALLDRLLPELPGILLWAIDGLRSLRQSKRFLQPASSQGVLDQLAELVSPIRAFVNQCCTLGPGKQEAKDDLFQTWKIRSEHRGYQSGSEATFGRNLLAAFPEIDADKRAGGGNRPWLYSGIAKQSVIDQIRGGL